MSSCIFVSCILSKTVMSWQPGNGIWNPVASSWIHCLLCAVLRPLSVSSTSYGQDVPSIRPGQIHHWIPSSQGEKNAWFQDPVKLEFLMSYHRKNSLRDKMVGKTWIYLEKPPPPPERVWTISEGEGGSHNSFLLSFLLSFYIRIKNAFFGTFLFMSVKRLCNVWASCVSFQKSLVYLETVIWN